MYSPWEKKTYWGVCNTIEDEASRVGTHLSKAEVELFFAIVDELREFDGEMDLVEAQNVSTQRHMPVAENGRVIQKLNQLQWLKIIRSQGNKASLILGPRAILELPKLRQWVRQVAQEKRQKEREQVKSQPDVELEEESDGEAPKGRKRRSSQALPDEMEDEEQDQEQDEDEVMQSRRGSQPRAVRRGGTRSSGR